MRINRLASHCFLMRCKDNKDLRITIYESYFFKYNDKQKKTPLLFLLDLLKIHFLMKEKINKILAAFGNAKAMERLQVDDHTEDIIKSVEGTPIGVSNKNVLYAGLDELGGYYFFKTIIVGDFNVKTMKGATLAIEGEGFSLNLKSDMDELESEYSNASRRNITNIDFEIEIEQVQLLKKGAIKSFSLSSKRRKVEFTPYKGKNSTQ